MLLTNRDIYTYTPLLATQFNNETCEMKLPVKINFFLQKNIKILIDLAQEIEKCRVAIITTYGTLDKEKMIYSFSEENTQQVNQELNDLLNIEQDVPLYVFKLEDFDGLEFTFAQMNALMFMIEE